MSDKHTSALIGNFGEHYVASQLAAAGCLVRPVANQADTGIDLYCETSVSSGRSNTPFVHFWVQVKTSTQFERAEHEFLYTLPIDRSAERPVTVKIRCRDLLYWERQPIPVFVACVAVNAWPPTEHPSLQILPMTDVLLGEHSPLDIDDDLNRNDPAASPDAKITLACSLVLPPFDQIALREFLDSVVPQHAAALHVRRGVVENIPIPREAYARASVTVPAHRFVPQILDQLHRTAAQAVLSAFKHGALLNFMSMENGGLIRSVVETFANAEAFQHWDDWLALALWQSAEGRHELAMASFASAARVIRNDWANLERHSRDWIVERKEWQQKLDWLDQVAVTGRVSHWFFTPLSADP